MLKAQYPEHTASWTMLGDLRGAYRKVQQWHATHARLGRRGGDKAPRAKRRWGRGGRTKSLVGSGCAYEQGQRNSVVGRAMHTAEAANVGVHRISELCLDGKGTHSDQSNGLQTEL
jgi:hypothetical protein